MSRRKRAIKRRMKPSRVARRHRRIALFAPRVTNKLVCYYNPVSKLPLPPTYRTTLCTGISGYFAVMGISTVAGAGTTFQGPVLNGLQSPFYNSYTPLPNQGLTSSTHYPTGFHNICNANTYLQYRVYASRVSLALYPSAITDQIEVVIYPGAVSVAADLAMATPWSKTKVFAANSGAETPLRNHIAIPTFYGIQWREVEDDPSNTWTGTSTLNPSVINWWNFAARDLIGANSVCGYKCEVEYDCEFFNLNNEQLFQT